jgi:hypothetical protein
MTRTEKIGMWAATILSCIALCGITATPVMSVIDSRYATQASVDAKITNAASEIKAELLDWRADDTEMWINYLDSKANHNEADDSDMVLLEAKLRQREELLKK